MYVILCIKVDISYVLNVCSRYQLNPSERHYMDVKNILKYLRRNKDEFLIYRGEHKFIVKWYSVISSQTDQDDFKLKLGFLLCLNGDAVSWKSSKQSIVVDFRTESKYIVLLDVIKEEV